MRLLVLAALPALLAIGCSGGSSTVADPQDAIPGATWFDETDRQSLPDGQSLFSEPEDAPRAMLQAELVNRLTEAGRLERLAGVDLERARSLYARVIELDPANENAWMRLGEIDEILGVDFDSVITSYQQGGSRAAVWISSAEHRRETGGPGAVLFDNGTDYEMVSIGWPPNVEVNLIQECDDGTVCWQEPDPLVTDRHGVLSRGYVYGDQGCWPITLVVQDAETKVEATLECAES